MLTKSLIYPIAAVTSSSFWRWTEKLEWMRWTLRSLALPLLPKQRARHSWEDPGGDQSKTAPTALLGLAAPMAQGCETPHAPRHRAGDLPSELNEQSRARQSSCTSHGSSSPLPNVFFSGMCLWKGCPCWTLHSQGWGSSILLLTEQPHTRPLNPALTGPGVGQGGVNQLLGSLWKAGRGQVWLGRRGEETERSARPRSLLWGRRREVTRVPSAKGCPGPASLSGTLCHTMGPFPWGIRLD